MKTGKIHKKLPSVKNQNSQVNRILAQPAQELMQLITLSIHCFHKRKLLWEKLFFPIDTVACRDNLLLANPPSLWSPDYAQFWRVFVFRR